MESKTIRSFAISEDLDDPKHEFVNVSVSYPRLCALCDDYLITPRCTAYQCSKCYLIFHIICGEFLNAYPSLCRQTNQIAHAHVHKREEKCFCHPDCLAKLDDAVLPQEQPLGDWKSTQIAHWLAVIGLGRFVTLFLRSQLNGSFLSNSTLISSHLDRIIDPFARQALRKAILVLTGDQAAVGENAFLLENLNLLKFGELLEPSESNFHNFQITSFFVEAACCFCKLPLLGFSHQGFQCKSCGIICHRVCRFLICLSLCEGQASGDITAVCTTEQQQMPIQCNPSMGDYLGKSLDDQLLNDQSQVPQFLHVCTRHIEQLAVDGWTKTKDDGHQVETTPIDLISVYQQSALVSTLNELHQQVEHRLPSDEFLDIVQLAQLVKSFLRVLPTPLIPQPNYREFCTLAHATDQSEAVNTFLSNLPHLHRSCLVHVFQHLHFVWKYQIQLEFYLSNKPTSKSSNVVCKPIKWLMIFRQILVQPPWNAITDLVTNLDIHLKALDVLFMVLSSESISVGVGGDGGGEVRNDMFDRLGNKALLKTKENEYYSSLFEVHNQLQSEVFDNKSKSTLSDPSPIPSSVVANREDLNKQEWYWGDISQSEVRDIMAGLGDGCFLVRDASARSTGTFTLVVRWQNENKLNRIYHRGDYFGVTNPPEPVFRLVSTLIDHLQHNPPQTANHIGFRLRHPISRRRHDQFMVRSPSALSLSNSDSHLSNVVDLTGQQLDASHLLSSSWPNFKLVDNFKRIEAELAAYDARIAALELQANQIVHERSTVMQLLKGYKTLQQWFNTQLNRLNDYSGPRVNAQITAQIDTIRSKLDQIENEIEVHNKILANRYTEACSIMEHQVQIITRRRKVKRAHQKMRCVFKQLGCDIDAHCATNEGNSNDCIDASGQVTRSATSLNRYGLGTPVRAQTRDDDIMSQRNWFLDNVTRDQVEELLATKPPGTFLIRPSTTGDRLALGLRLANSTQHCLIYHVGGKFGFVEKACVFDSLEALVRHYHVNSLQKYNPLLTTTLKYPFNLV